MRYWLLLTTHVPLNMEHKVIHKQRSKIAANDLAHAIAMEKELCFDYVDHSNAPPVWMEGEVCAEVHIGRQGGLLFIPVDRLSSLSMELGRASDEYYKEKNKIPSVKVKSFSQNREQGAKLGDILPKATVHHDDDEG